jgi:hypothetical protein
VTQKESSRRWYAAHKEEAKRKRAEYVALNKEKVKAKNKAYRQKHPEKARAWRNSWSATPAGRAYNKAYNLAKKYGLTLEQHRAVYLSQNGCCAACGIPTAYNEVHTDHDHKTGKVRGLLCGSCNKGLGLFNDSIEILKRVIKYLRSYSNERV